MRWVWVALRPGGTEVTPAMVERMGGRVLFGGARSVERWSLWLDGGRALVESWRCETEGEDREPITVDELLRHAETAVPVAVGRSDRLRLVDEETRLGAGDELHLVVLDTARSELESVLRAQGWERMTDDDQDET